MNYAVKEIYYPLQGEGANTGRPAVFLRFAGCNLWTGREADRADAVCGFCDTDFVGTDGPGGGRFATAADLARAVAAAWPGDGTARGRPFVVCTGGKPLLQLDEPLIAALHRNGCEVAIETNGTRVVPRGIDWTCVSPKAGAEFVVKSGDELKLVYPQEGAEPERYVGLDFGHFFLQPMDGPERVPNTELAVRYCLAHPQWRLSLQTHKVLGDPLGRRAPRCGSPWFVLDRPARDPKVCDARQHDARQTVAHRVRAARQMRRVNGLHEPWERNASAKP